MVDVLLMFKDSDVSDHLSIIIIIIIIIYSTDITFTVVTVQPKSGKQCQSIPNRYSVT